MNQQPPLVLTKNIRIILGQFGIFVLLWSCTVLDYGGSQDKLPLLVEFVRDTFDPSRPDTGGPRTGVLWRMTWWLRSMRPARPAARPLVRATIAQPVRLRRLAQAPMGKPRLRLGTQRFRHGGAVTALAASPETNLLASCGMDGQVRIWNAETGEAIKRLPGNGEPLPCVALSRDGRWVAAGGQQGMLYLWEVANGKRVAAWQIDRSSVQGVAFAPDGRTLAALRNAVQGVAFAPDGRTLFSPDGDHEISLWDVPAASKLWSWRGDVQGLFFSPDGKVLATFLRNDPPGSRMPGGSVIFLDAATGRQRVGIAQPEDIGAGLAFSPDGTTLAIGGRDGTVRLWEMATGKKLHSLEGHSRNVNHAAFSPDGKTLASASSDIRLWDVATGTERCRLGRTGHWVVSLAFSRDSKTLFSADDDHAIHLWDTATGEEIQSDDGQGAVTAVAIAPDGHTAVTTGKDAILHTWDLAAGKPIRQYRGHGKPVQFVAYSTDGHLLASAAGRSADRRESEVRLWNTSTGEEARRWDGNIQPAGQLRFLPDKRSLAALDGSEGLMRIWDTTTGAELYRLGDNRATYSSFSPDGSLLALWGAQSVRVWDVANRRLASEVRPEISFPAYNNMFQGYRDMLTPAPALSPGGHYIACATWHEGGVIHVFKVATGEELDFPQGHTAAMGTPVWRMPVSALAWSHDCKTLASGGGDGQVWLWDLAATTALLHCEGHEGLVTSLAFASDDQTLVSGSDDTTALVWDLSDLRDASKKQSERK